MNLRGTDLEWLASHYPELEYKPDSGTIEGRLGFCAAFDRMSGQLLLGDSTEIRAMDTFLCDAFAVTVDLRATGPDGWPSIREVGNRSVAIAKKNNCPLIDLHLFENGTFCLGLSYAPSRNLTLQRFVQELVVPFLYRLAYADRHGLEAARAHLWGEYSHGDGGHRQYQREMLALADHDPGRNQPCPCGSGQKYKRCHYEDVEAVKRLTRRI